MDKESEAIVVSEKNDQKIEVLFTRTVKGALWELARRRGEARRHERRVTLSDIVREAVIPMLDQELPGWRDGRHIDADDK